MNTIIHATEAAIIRLLKAGHPLPATIIGREEGLRLPVFQSIEVVAPNRFGLPGSGRIVLARGRKDIWFVDIRRLTPPVSKADAENLLAKREQIKRQYANHTITGWLVATSAVDPAAKEFINLHGCVVTGHAERR